jgi:hypothetical protein
LGRQTERDDNVAEVRNASERAPATEAVKTEKDPFVFIVGCARSGTTLLQRIVDAHQQIAITPEMHWVTDALRDGGKWLNRQGRVTEEQVSQIVRHERFREFQLIPEEVEDLLSGGTAPSPVTFLKRLFALYGRIREKDLVGNKTPAYVLKLPSLSRRWPRVKFVHLIRDGRDVTLSVLNWSQAAKTAGRYSTWSEDPVSTTALWWERKVRLGRQGGASLDAKLYHEIRYEELVVHPDVECARLCGFFDVPYDGAMLRFHEGRTRSDPGLDAKAAWLPITAGLRDWRSQMCAEDIERFEAIAGDYLEELGYPRACPSPSRASREHASKIRELYTHDAPARREELPEEW